ncbi:hypothetical protein HK096_011132, partial [Nowakowskiella sp. JEL0078]
MENPKNEDDLESKIGSERADKSEIAVKTKVFVFVALDKSMTVRMWDITRVAPSKPRATIKLSTSINDLTYLTKYGMFAGCSHDKSIK